MSRARWTLLSLLLFPLVFTTLVRTAEQTLIPAGAIWKYNDSGATLGTSWRNAAFNDLSWFTGPAQLGYGDGGEATVLSYGGNASNKRITYYFRHSFNVADPAAFSGLTLRFVRDDGVVIYVNGAEVVRSNMPSGTITSTTLATTAIGGAAEEAFQQVALAPSVLVAGLNLIAVELHQQSVTSTDIGFDLELLATDASPAPPTVTLDSPVNGSVTNASAVTFVASTSAPAGLASATLYVGGPPQTVTFSGSAQVQDAQITADTPTTPNGAGLAINIDGLTPHAHGLMKFPTLIGGGGGQVPAGAIITSATLQVNCTNPGLLMSLYRLTEDWVEGEATWNQRAFGTPWQALGADGAGSNAQVPVAGDCTTGGLRSINLTRFVQEWSDGAPNYGVLFADSGADGVDFDSSESASSPILTVVYRSGQTPMGTQPLSGTNATVQFPVSLAMGTYFWNVEVLDSLGRRSFAPADFTLTLDAAVPNEPVLVAPANGAVGTSTSPTLSAVVSNPAGGQLTATVSLRRAVEPEFTIIALPDTQHYSEAFPAIFTSQTQWIVANKAARNIVFVTHEGDVVQNQSVTAEWDRANTSMTLLDGVVPYGIGPGNHDQPTTNFNIYFPYTRYASQPWYGGHMGTLNDNNFQLFSGGGMDFVIVHLTFCPPAAAVTWADNVFKSYPNRIGIMTTHGYLNEAAQRTVHGCTNTQYLWDGLALPNPNLHFMLSGHVHDESRRSDVANGHPVFQMLADYQDRASGGEGWLRILRFVPAEDKIHVQTYSPWLNRFESDANSEFTLDFPMGGAFADTGSTVAGSGATANVPVSALEPNTQYEWRMTVTNAAGKSRTSPVWTFTTGSSSNQPPAASNQTVPTSEDLATPITLGASDPEGSALTFAIVTGTAHGSLSGTAPNLIYIPAANFNGSDSFTFTASDGVATSNLATVSIAIQPVNDAPTATGDAYTIQAGSTLTVNAPGVLGNDADIDGPPLHAQLVSNVTHGSLGLTDSGALTYTPSAGYSGPDAFTYRASDGFAASATVTVAITVTPAPPPGPVFSASFNTGQDSFSYVDDAFRGTSQPSFASGSRVSSGGFTGGALRVEIGGVNNKAVTSGMSGGWRRTFTLTNAATLAVIVRYNLTQSADYDPGDISEVLAAINGLLIPSGSAVAQLQGNGNGGTAQTTGWVQVEIPLGSLPAGTHALTLGGFNNRKDGKSELTTVLIDDVSVVIK